MFLRFLFFIAINLCLAVVSSREARPAATAPSAGADATATRTLSTRTRTTTEEAEDRIRVSGRLSGTTKAVDPLAVASLSCLDPKQIVDLKAALERTETTGMTASINFDPEKCEATYSVTSSDAEKGISATRIAPIPVCGCTDCPNPQPASDTASPYCDQIWCLSCLTERQAKELRDKGISVSETDPFVVQVPTTLDRCGLVPGGSFSPTVGTAEGTCSFSLTKCQCPPPIVAEEEKTEEAPPARHPEEPDATRTIDAAPTAPTIVPPSPAKPAEEPIDEICCCLSREMKAVCLSGPRDAPVRREYPLGSHCPDVSLKLAFSERHQALAALCERSLGKPSVEDLRKLRDHLAEDVAKFAAGTGGEETPRILAIRSPSGKAAEWREITPKEVTVTGETKFRVVSPPPAALSVSGAGLEELLEATSEAASPPRPMEATATAKVVGGGGFLGGCSLVREWTASPEYRILLEERKGDRSLRHKPPKMRNPRGTKALSD